MRKIFCILAFLFLNVPLARADTVLDVTSRYVDVFGASIVLSGKDFTASGSINLLCNIPNIKPSDVVPGCDAPNPDSVNWYLLIMNVTLDGVTTSITNDFNTLLSIGQPPTLFEPNGAPLVTLSIPVSFGGVIGCTNGVPSGDPCEEDPQFDYTFVFSKNVEFTTTWLEQPDGSYSPQDARYVLGVPEPGGLLLIAWGLGLLLIAHAAGGPGRIPSSGSV